MNLSKNKQLQEEHRKSIQDELNNLLDMQKKSNNPEVLNYGINLHQKFLENFSADFLHDAQILATSFFKKYEYFKKIHFPVVYVAKVQSEWFENSDEFEIHDDKSLELRVKTDVPNSSIIARIDFPNDVECMTVSSNGPQPVLWEKEEWNKQ